MKDMEPESFFDFYNDPCFMVEMTKESYRHLAQKFVVLFQDVFTPFLSSSLSKLQFNYMSLLEMNQVLECFNPTLLSEFSVDSYLKTAIFPFISGPSYFSLSQAKKNIFYLQFLKLLERWGQYVAHDVALMVLQFIVTIFKYSSKDLILPIKSLEILEFFMNSCREGNIYLDISVDLIQELIALIYRVDDLEQKSDILKALELFFEVNPSKELRYWAESLIDIFPQLWAESSSNILRSRLLNLSAAIIPV
jgi:hypothetical protein